jgi:hypothetical protein
MIFINGLVLFAYLLKKRKKPLACKVVIAL